jgi:hypothetical protein
MVSLGLPSSTCFMFNEELQQKMQKGMDQRAFLFAGNVDVLSSSGSS